MENSEDNINHSMSKRRRALYAVYGLILLATRPVRCVWFAFAYNRTVPARRHSLRRAYRILQELDGLRTHPAAERWLMMMLSTHIQDRSGWK